MSIIRIGLAETKHFAEGYSAIFGGKKKKDEPEKAAETQAKQAPAKKAAKPAKNKGKK